MEAIMSIVACSICHQVYPPDQTPFRCECGGVYDYLEFPQYSLTDDYHSSGIYKYKNLLGFNPGVDLISLGEGGTPLVTVKIGDREIFLKLENMNPTGSYKDRGTVVLMNFLRARGVSFAVEDSSGNAGASFAAYCARIGMNARVFVPESASGPKRTQIERYGADLVSIPGPRAESAKAVMQAAHSGAVYASHAWMPFGLTGIATIAYEIIEQLGSVPNTIVAPVGHGGLFYGIMRGFESMVETGEINHEPHYVGVQASGCEPLVDAYRRKSNKIREIKQGDTSAEGVRVTHPVRAKAILDKLLHGKGEMISVEESQLVDAWYQSARMGFFMEPTSALVWAALQTRQEDFKAPIVAVITGSGYKSTILQKME